MAKANKGEIAKRIDEILTIRLDGAARHDICRYATEKGWEVSERQIERYIETVDKQLTAAKGKRRKLVVGLHLARREALLARAINAGDFRTALAILTDTAKLQQLYPEKEAKELARIIADQARQIAELEALIRGSQPDPKDGDEEREAPGETPGSDGTPDP